MDRSGYLQGAGSISTSDAKLAEPFLKGVDALCFCNLIWEGVPQVRAVGEESALEESAEVCVHGTRNWALSVLLLAGACMMGPMPGCQQDHELSCTSW